MKTTILHTSFFNYSLLHLAATDLRDHGLGLSKTVAECFKKFDNQDSEVINDMMSLSKSIDLDVSNEYVEKLQNALFLSKKLIKLAKN